MENRPIKTKTELKTKERILVAAEELVAQEGFDRVSLRDITAAADVNLAAVHYHYGSKDGLIDALLTRYIRPINLDRLRMLEQTEAEFGEKPVPVERIVEAFIRPLLDRLGHHGISAMLFFKMVGRCMSERSYRLPDALMPVFEQVAARYVQSLRRTLPEIPEDVILWRMHFIFGSVAHTLAHAENLHKISLGRSGEVTPELIMRRLIAFTSAGLRAPVNEESEMDSVMATDLR